MGSVFRKEKVQYIFLSHHFSVISLSNFIASCLLAHLQFWKRQFKFWHWVFFACLAFYEFNGQFLGKELKSGLDYQGQLFFNFFELEASLNFIMANKANPGKPKLED